MVLKKKQNTPFNLLDYLVQQAPSWPANAGLKPENSKLFIESMLDGDSIADLEKRPTDEAEAITKGLWKKFQTRRYEDILIDVEELNVGQMERVDITILQRQIPFITDSILNFLRQHHLSVTVMLNAAVKVRRDDEGTLLSVHADEDYGPDLQADKVLYLQCEHRGEELDKEKLRQSLSDIIRDVFAAVEDWKPMQSQIIETINDLEGAPKSINSDEAFEAANFLTFLMDGNFTFLGYREHTLRRTKQTTYFDEVQNKSLGLLRDDTFLVFDGLVSDELIPDVVQKVLIDPQPLLIVLKANRRSTVHRNVHMDVIIIKKYDAKGNVEKLRLFSGLFTSQCYAKPTDQIPYLKHKVNTVLTMAGYDSNTHQWRAMKHVLDSYPRDELFQISADDLYDHATGIMRLNNRPEVDVFIRRDILQRYFSAIVYLPKEQYDTELRGRIQDILQEELQGVVVSHYMMVDEKPLGRLQYMVACSTTLLPDYNIEHLRSRLRDVCTPWADRLKIATVAAFGKQRSQTLLHSLSRAFSVSYQDQVTMGDVLQDLEPLQQIIYERDMVVKIDKPQSEQENFYRIKIFRRYDEASLSELLPMLDRMGFHCIHEYSYQFSPSGVPFKIWLHELVGPIDNFNPERLDEIQPIFAEAFEQIWNRKVDSDSFNSLVIAAELTWREANLFRAFARYLDLASYPLGKRYIGQVLARYPAITKRLCDLFLTRHDPSLDRDKAELEAAGIIVEIDHLLEKVEKLDEDRALRSILAVVREVLRTNYFHTDENGDPRDNLVLKLNAQVLLDLPQPRPYREIFVFGSRMESVHLRGGPIARGGLRWSDRYEDFRTEVLSLVKAQIVKNAVIVPVGSKGGFICKNQPNLKTPQERQAEGIACYQMMIRGMLSVTDNIVDGKIIPPANTVCLDGDDPYLVVAADKGTATFSDIANKISLDHGFWLGDAFASGGSKGYDHKAMGITAKGAWECIKRHFREMGKDIQTTPFTVAGVGDMSGDVFGNGMLLSEQTQLVAAFDHRHIFVDPQPDQKKSFAERKRLFELPGSSWGDYNAKLLSKGGMVYSRQEKSLALTPEIRQLLDIEAERVTPIELIQAILKSRVELLYFGGIGTYLKASTQTHEQVGDKSNDATRINAKELRCKVIGEGANLAMTQAARIEFAQNGGRLNTDFIDNSAGVDTSDHEVNIKILLNPLVASKVMTEEDRNRLLSDMTDEVGAHVLKNNYDQSLALSLVQQRANEELTAHAQFMRQLERDGIIDRKLEGLPDDDTIQRFLQRNQGLTRPELAVLLAYSKIALYNQLLESHLADDPALQYQLFEYFPDALQNKFKEAITHHKLKREIIATEVTNVIINRMGPVFVANGMIQIGASAEALAKAWLLTRSAFDLKTLWAEIDSMDNKIPAVLQFELYEQLIDVMAEGVKWFLQHHTSDLNLDKLIPLYRDELAQLQSLFTDVLPAGVQDEIKTQQLRLDRYEALRPDIKKRLSQLPILLAGCDVVYISQKTSASPASVAKAYFALSERLKITQLRRMAQAILMETSWAQEAVDSLEDELRSMLADLTLQFLKTGKSVEDIDAWLNDRKAALHAVDLATADLERIGSADLPLMSVLTQRLRRLVYQGAQ